MGLKPDVTREKFEKAIGDGTAEYCLEHVPVRAGEAIFVPARTAHTIGAGFVLCEIQQYSDLTYRVYDYNRRDASGKTRELHIEKALEVLRFGEQSGGKVDPVRIERGGVTETYLAACRYFATEKWEFEQGVAAASSREHFDLLIFLEGNGSIEWSDGTAEYASGPTVDDSRGARCVRNLAAISNGVAANLRAGRHGRIRGQARRARRGTEPLVQGGLHLIGRRGELGMSAKKRKARIVRGPACGWARNALLAAQPHAHAEATAEYRRQRNHAAETVQRLAAVFGPRNFWAVTNEEQAAAVRRELPGVPASHILAEPVGRNTAAAIGLAAIHLAHEHGDALMGVLPSDSYVANAAALSQSGSRGARSGANAWPPCGAGNSADAARNRIRLHRKGQRLAGVCVARRPMELRGSRKSPISRPRDEYAASGNYFWNAGMFFWRVSTFLQNLRRFLPATYDALEGLGRTIGTRRYASALRTHLSET